MDFIRVLLAVFIFTISSYLVYDLFAAGFNWLVLVAAFFGYILVHYVWPRSSKKEENWYDVLELFFDLPYRLITFIGRGISKILRGGDSDIGIDL